MERLRIFRAIRFCAIAVVVGSISASPCRAGDTTVGNWVVKTEKDPSSNKRTISAKIADGTKGSLTIRCALPGGLGISIEVGSKQTYAPGASVDVAYGADQDAPSEQKAKAVEATSVLVSEPRPILQDALAARTLRFRLRSPEGKTADLNFSPVGAGQALTQILLDCPADPPSSR